MAERRIDGAHLLLALFTCVMAATRTAEAGVSDATGLAADTVRLERQTVHATAALPSPPGLAGEFRRTRVYRSAPDLTAHDVRPDSDLDRGVATTTLGSAMYPVSAVAGATHDSEVSSNRFRFTTLRLWAYRSFLPKSSDSDVLGIEVNSAWGVGKLDFINISYFEVADYPRPVPGKPFGNPVPGSGGATGITDLLTAILVSPKRVHHGPHHFAAGISAQLPTASDDTLGSGKWCLGPAVEYEYHKGRLFAGFIALNLWSFAGDADRKNVNMLMVKPMVTYDLSRCWKAVYMPYGISVYWEKSRADMAYLPLGGGLQHEFRIGQQKVAASLQFFKYVLRPSKGSEYDLRFMLEIDF